jgi:hypothetical protein
MRASGAYTVGVNSERAQAYGRVMRTMDDLAAAKLLDEEEQRIRAAADALFFAEDLGEDAEARGAVTDIRDLARHLVESDRWLEERARALVDDVVACGPTLAVR